MSHNNIKVYCPLHNKENNGKSTTYNKLLKNNKPCCDDVILKINKANTSKSIKIFKIDINQNFVLLNEFYTLNITELHISRDKFLHIIQSKSSPPKIQNKINILFQQFII